MHHTTEKGKARYGGWYFSAQELIDANLDTLHQECKIEPTVRYPELCCTMCGRGFLVAEWIWFITLPKIDPNIHYPLAHAFFCDSCMEPWTYGCSSRESRRKSRTFTIKLSELLPYKVCSNIRTGVV